VGRGIAPGAAAPAGAGVRWERIPLPTLKRHGQRVRTPLPIVFSVAYGDRSRSCASDPGLLLITAFSLAAIGLGAFDRLLFALLMWLF
jgi:hypothetical protein